jgi:hypothetical protein
MSIHSNGSCAAAEDLLTLAVTQGQHATEITNLKESTKRVENKLEKLFWMILATLVSAVGSLLSALHHG